MQTRGVSLADLKCAADRRALIVNGAPRRCVAAWCEITGRNLEGIGDQDGVPKDKPLDKNPSRSHIYNLPLTHSHPI